MRDIVYFRLLTNPTPRQRGMTLMAARRVAAEQGLPMFEREEKAACTI